MLGNPTPSGARLPSRPPRSSPPTGAKIMLRRSFPAGSRRRSTEIRQGRWADGPKGRMFDKEEYRAWSCQVGFRGEAVVQLSHKP